MKLLAFLIPGYLEWLVLLAVAVLIIAWWVIARRSKVSAVQLLKDRRVIYLVGVALLVAGWGSTRLFDLIQSPLSTTTTSYIGILVMATGAGLIGFAALRKNHSGS